MKGDSNEQFPPISPNGTGAAHKTKKNGSTHQPQETTQETKRPDQARSTASAKQRSTGKRTRQTAKLEQDDERNSAQIISAKLSAYITNYPMQTIGGLLAVLLLVVLFKTFYQGKSWKAKRMAEEAYFVANQYARNNSTNLHPYLSQSFRKGVRQTPGLLPLSMQTATHGGTVTGAESMNLREITSDSVVVEMTVSFENGREEKMYQPLVYEKDQWRLGLTYSR